MYRVPRLVARVLTICLLVGIAVPMASAQAPAEAPAEAPTACYSLEAIEVTWRAQDTEGWETRFGQVEQQLEGPEHALRFAWSYLGDAYEVASTWTAPPQEICPGDLYAYSQQLASAAPSDYVNAIASLRLKVGGMGDVSGCASYAPAQYLQGDEDGAIYECEMAFADVAEPASPEMAATIVVESNWMGPDGITVVVTYFYTSPLAPAAPVEGATEAEGSEEATEAEDVDEAVGADAETAAEPESADEEAVEAAAEGEADAAEDAAVAAGEATDDAIAGEAGEAETAEDAAEAGTAEEASEAETAEDAAEAEAAEEASEAETAEEAAEAGTADEASEAETAVEAGAAEAGSDEDAAEVEVDEAELEAAEEATELESAEGAVPDPMATSPDIDRDGLTLVAEEALGTDPLDPNTDGDDMRDGAEVEAGRDPLDPTDALPLGDDIAGLVDPCDGLDDGVWLVIGSGTSRQGRAVRIPVTLCNASDLGDLNATIAFDPQVLQVTGVMGGDLLNAALFDANLEPQGEISLGIADVEGLSGDGYVGYLGFDVIGAPGSRTLLDGYVSAAHDLAAGRPVWVAVRDGAFTVDREGLKGDWNNDLRINSVDALAALRMSIGKIPQDLILDMNDDGSVTALDARWILAIAP